MHIKNLKTCSFTLVGAFICSCDSANDISPAPTAQPAEISYQVEESVLGKNVTFQSSPASLRAELTLTCDDGKVEGMMIKLDVEPSSPPPLRGVFGLFHFEHEPIQKIELGYFEKGAWSMREGQEDVVNNVARRFASGRALYFTLNKPNGPGDEIAWHAPNNFDERGCSLRP